MQSLQPMAHALRKNGKLRSRPAPTGGHVVSKGEMQNTNKVTASDEYSFF